MGNAEFRSLEQALADSWPPGDWCDVTVLAAVSGGPDSVALLRALAELKTAHGGRGRLVVAHFNHRLRPESEEDSQFVAALAEQLKLPFEQGAADVAELAKQCGDGIESAARDARYDFLQRAAEKLGARYVATGHTADDQVETVLFNVLRGTGLSGLAGIPRARPLGPAASLIRPLLGVRRQQIIEYLSAIGQPFRWDASNANRDFTRNRLRNELLPLLRDQFNPDVDNAIVRLSQIAGDAQRVIERLAEELLDRSLVQRAASPGVATPGLARDVVFNTAGLQKIDRHLLREMFLSLWRRLDWPQQQMGFAEWDQLAEMAVQPGPKRVLPGEIVVECSDQKLKLSRPGNKTAD